MSILDDLEGGAGAVIKGGKEVLGKTPAGKAVGAVGKTVGKALSGRARFVPIDEPEPRSRTADLADDPATD